MTDTLSPRPRRPFRTAILLLAGLILAGLVAVVVHEVQAVRRHMAAVQTVIERTGTISYGMHFEHASYSNGYREDQSERPWLQRLAAHVLGEKSGEWPVECLPLYETGADVDVSFLSGFPELKCLTIGMRDFSDDDLSVVARLSKLEVLELHSPSVSSAGIGRLTRPGGGWPPASRAVPALPNLVILDLSGTGIDDTCLGDIARFPRLESLFLRETRVSDAGVAAIARMPRLKALDLAQTHVSDAGVGALELPNLEDLSLDRTDVSDQGLAALVDLPHLEWLFATETDLSDAAVAVLVQCRHLKHVDIIRTRITEAGAGRLRAALPDCKVDHSGPE